MLYLDIETRAPADAQVPDVGLYRHAPHANILGLRYLLPGDEEPREWRGYFADGETVDCADGPPQDLIEAVQGGMPIVAHNAAYERVVMRESPNVPWWPDVPITQYICSAAWAASFNLPRGLEKLSKLLLPADLHKRVEVATGVKYMWNSYNPLGDPTHMDLQMDYCAGDVIATKAIMEMLPPVDPDWLLEYHAAEAINDRGVMVDGELAEAAVDLSDWVDRQAAAALSDATDGLVKPRGPTLLKWLKTILPEHLQSALVVNDKYRVGYGFRTKQRRSTNQQARDALRAALEREENYDFEHAGTVLQALDLFEQANMAAVRKFNAALTRCNDDRRLRGQFVFSGASQTGRFSSTGVQVHNLKREVDAQAAEIIDLVKQKVQAQVLVDRFALQPSEALSAVLRPLFVAPAGRALGWGDWSSIEARALPWLTGDSTAEPMLDAFRQGKDIYVQQASQMNGRPEAEIDKDERQIGKVAVLSLGYQGGVGAFTSMARNYGVEVSAEEARRVRDTWRAANPWAPRFWARLEDAAMDVINNGMQSGETYSREVGRLMIQFAPGLLDGSMLIWLPDNSWLCYPQARVKEIEKFEDSPLEPAVTFMHPTYGPTATYGGMIAENVTQATCARLLRNALVWCEDEQLNTVLHVHDEIVIEADEAQIDRDSAVLQDIMRDVPDWAKGLPLDADVEVGYRYKIQRLPKAAAAE